MKMAALLSFLMKQHKTHRARLLPTRPGIKIITYVAAYREDWKPMEGSEQFSEELSAGISVRSVKFLSTAVAEQIPVKDRKSRSRHLFPSTE